MQGGVEQNPLILTLLQKNQLPQLIRMMFNRRLSQQYLQLYGASGELPLRRVEEMQLQDYVSRFQVKDIIQFKGSHRGIGGGSRNIRYHCNTYIQQFLARKLARGHRLTPQERKTAFLQLTEYYQLQNLYEGLADLELPPEVSALIKKDVNRTYLSPDLNVGVSQAEFKVWEAGMRAQLTQVLQRIAKYNPYIGYCQGMNTVVLFLLEVGWSPCEAFFVFKKISEELLPCDFYASMDSTMALVRLFFEVLQITHPRAVSKMKQIIRHMEGEDRFIITVSFVFQWFVCLFTNVNLPRSARLAIFDRFLLEGMPAMFKGALAFFDVLQEPIQKVRGIQDYMPEVERRMREFSEMGVLEGRLSGTYINGNIMQLLREKMVLQGRGTRKRESKDNCNPKWNICLQAVEDHLAAGSRLEFFVFRVNEEIRIIDNYFEKAQNSYFRIGKGKTRSIDQLRLGRMAHSCRPSSSSKTNDDEHSKGSFLECSEEGVSLNSNSHLKEGHSPSKKAVKVAQFECGKEGERKQLVRTKALQSLQEERRSVFNRSQSVQFMRSMIQNESFSNLLQILQEDQMENIFRSVISEDDE